MASAHPGSFSWHPRGKVAQNYRKLSFFRPAGLVFDQSRPSSHPGSFSCHPRGRVAQNYRKWLFFRPAGQVFDKSRLLVGSIPGIRVLESFKSRPRLGRVFDHRKVDPGWVGFWVVEKSTQAGSGFEFLKSRPMLGRVPHVATLLARRLTVCSNLMSRSICI